jgi:transcriptional regulator
MGTIRAGNLYGTLEMLILRGLDLCGPMHGVGVADHIGSRSAGLFRVEEGSLYPALSRMEKRGWIRSEWGASETNRKAKYYNLTPQGRTQLHAQSQGWDRLVEAMTLVLDKNRA